MKKHREENTTCFECDNTFAFKQQLVDHQKRVHVKGQPFLCKTCGSKFKSQTTLKQHELLHLPECEKPYLCIHCDKRFPRNCSLTEHLRKFHSSEPAKYHCDQCEYSTYQSSNLKDHILRSGH